MTTIEELYSLPDDGNKYELIRGQLFVTPVPTDGHETIGARLHRLLDPYVAANGLGLIYRPRSVIRVGDDTEVEPDLMVRQPQDDPDASWVGAPIPILVVEIASDSTRRRDRMHKRSIYAEASRVHVSFRASKASRGIAIIPVERPLCQDDRDSSLRSE